MRFKDALRRWGEDVIRENDEVRGLARFERAFERFVE